MTVTRLSLALEARLFDLPEAGIVLAMGAIGPDILSLMPPARLVVLSPLRTVHEACAAGGIRAVTDAEGLTPALCLVVAPRSKTLARGLVAQAAALGAGAVVIDGQKTDGIDSLLRELRPRAREMGAAFAKAHGKTVLARLEADALSDWALPAEPVEVAPGLVTRPGVFSADGIDPASALLASALPPRPGARVADLGAGWGYLSARLLGDETVRTLHLVENDHTALDCARRNVTDPRAAFHWADATRWRPEAPLDAVVMNPPFHSGRTADPDLGRAFIAAAAACLAPQGRLIMVANRHLPYEAALSASFAETREIAGDARFKVLLSQRPARHRGSGPVR